MAITPGIYCDKWSLIAVHQKVQARIKKHSRNWNKQYLILGSFLKVFKCYLGTTCLSKFYFAFLCAVSINPTHVQVAPEPRLLCNRSDRRQVAFQGAAGLFGILPHPSVSEGFVAVLAELVPVSSGTRQLSCETGWKKKSPMQFLFLFQSSGSFQESNSLYTKV